MTSFKKGKKEPKKLHKKVFEHFKLICLCLKIGKKYLNNLTKLFLFLNDVIRNPLHGIIGFVNFLYIFELNDDVWRAIFIE